MSESELRNLIKDVDLQLQDLVGHITCSVCHDIFQSPVTASCGHTFCQACLKRVVANKNNNGCPLCKKAINRREISTDIATSAIVRVCLDLPSAFRTDITNMGVSTGYPMTECLASSKICQLSNHDNAKNKTTCRTMAETNKKEADDSESFVPILRRSKKVIQYSCAKKKIQDDLISVSQRESNSDAEDISGLLEKKLQNLTNLPSDEKINHWFNAAGENLFLNSSDNSLFVEDNKNKLLGNSKEIDGPSTTEKKETRKSKPELMKSSSMVRVDYLKSIKSFPEKNIKPSCSKMNTDENDAKSDPYEFIASQHSTVPKKKRIRRSGRTKKIPDFHALQSFTKESVRRNALLSNILIRNAKTIENSEDASSGPEDEPEKPLSDSIAPLERTLTDDPPVTASQRFEELLAEPEKTESKKRHTLYSPTQNLSDLSLACSYQSDVIPNTCARRTRGERKSTSEDTFIPRLFETPKKNKELAENISSDSDLDGKKSVIPKRKRPSKKVSSVPKRKRTANCSVPQGYEVEDNAKRLSTDNGGGKKKTRLTELLEEMLIDKAIVCPQTKNTERPATPLLEPGKSVCNVSNASKSPGWSRVSGLKSDFESPKRHKLKSLIVSGGEHTGNISTTLNTPKTVNPVTEDRLDSADLKYTDTYIDDLSQCPDLVTGFSAQNYSSPEAKFKKMVEEMEEEVDASISDLTLVEMADSECSSPSLRNPVIPVSPITHLSSPLYLRTNPVPSTSEEVPAPVPVRDEQYLSQTPLSEKENAIPLAHSDECASSIPIEDQLVKLVGKGSAHKRKTNPKTIPFTLLGKIKNKKNSSVIFLRLGGLTPMLRRSRSTVVKFVMPRGFSNARTKLMKPKRVTVGVQTVELNRPSTSIKPTTTSSSVQTALCTTSTEVQTSQYPRESVEVQTTQVLQNSIGVQTSQSVVTSEMHTSQTEKNIIGIQTSQLVEQASEGFQTSQKMVDKSLSRPEWDDSGDLAAVPSQVFLCSPKAPPKQAKSELCFIDTQFQSEFDRSWKSNEKKEGATTTKGAEKKSSQSLITSYIGTQSSDSDDVIRYSEHKGSRVGRILSRDLSSPVETLPEKFEGRQLIPLEVRKINEEDVPVVDLITQCEMEDSQTDSQELLKRVFRNIDLDLQLAKKAEQKDFDEVIQDEKSKVKCPNGEESDSDMFVEQTPPKPMPRIRETMNKSLPRANIDEKAAESSEGTDIIPDSAPVLPVKPEESVLVLVETPDKFQVPELPGSAQKPPSFPNKKSFFDAPDENDQNKPNGVTEKRSTEAKAAQTKAVLEAWKRSEAVGPSTKRKICIVASSVENPGNIEKFVSRFKAEYSTRPVKHMTHLVVGLHESEDDGPLPYCTPKLLFALANQKWIVSELWIETCLKTDMILPEESFESLDPIGGNGCKTARLAKELLLKDCEVYLLGDFEMISKEDFAELVLSCGGTLVQQPNKFSMRPGRIRMVVVDRDCLKLDEKDLQDMFDKYKTAVLSRDVVIQSIQSYKLVNFTSHLMTLTSEEELLKLGYPYPLVKHEEESEWSTFK